MTQAYHSMRKSGFSQETTYSILQGKPVKKKTLTMFRRAMGI
jgi:hypothetical protein